MPNYNFNKDNRKLTDNEIEKHKNFNKLKANYNKATKPLYKIRLFEPRNRKYLFGIILILIILYIVFTVDNKGNNKNEKPKIEKITE